MSNLIFKVIIILSFNWVDLIVHCYSTAGAAFFSLKPCQYMVIKSSDHDALILLKVKFMRLFLYFEPFENVLYSLLSFAVLKFSIKRWMSSRPLNAKSSQWHSAEDESKKNFSILIIYIGFH